MRTYMADVLLRDSDMMSMRNSLELRVPFIDRPLIEWLWRRPPVWMTRKRPKSALAEAAADVLRQACKAQERGFTMPFSVWMRSDLRHSLRTLSPPGASAERPFFDRLGAVDLARFSSGATDRECRDCGASPCSSPL